MLASPDWRSGLLRLGPEPLCVLLQRVNRLVWRQLIRPKGREAGANEQVSRARNEDASDQRRCPGRQSHRVQRKDDGGDDRQQATIRDQAAANNEADALTELRSLFGQFGP